jgi:hypothetical protein
VASAPSRSCGFRAGSSRSASARAWPSGSCCASSSGRRCGSDEALRRQHRQAAVGDLLDALRHDGHPPLYYLILHWWMEAFGQGDVAVRACRASSPWPPCRWPGWPGAGWPAVRRSLGAGGGGAVALLHPLRHRDPHVRAGHAAGAGRLPAGGRCPRPPDPAPAGRHRGGVGPAAAQPLSGPSTCWRRCWPCSPALVAAARQPAGHRPGRAGDHGRRLLFVPWLGGFLYQSQHTGTPWGVPFRPQPSSRSRCATWAAAS